MMLNRVSLNTIGLNRIGLNRIGKPSRASSDRPYIDPEVLASLKAVCICYGKSNDDPDRAVVKNLVDPDNPFVISNAAFKLNSGFGKYEVDFTEYRSGNLIYVSRILPNSILATTDGPGEKALLAKFPSNENDDINDYKVEIKLTEGVQVVYKYIDNTGTLKRKYLNTSGIYDLPKSYISKLPSEFNDSIGFSASGVGEIYLSQIPSFEGAFVTDGVNDLITSTKTVQEMLRGSSEYTVLSMIHHIDVPEGNIHSNTVRIKLGSWGTSNRITSFSNNKTGIYGYTVKNQNITVINNILGDKNDYGIRGGDYTSNLEAKFSVVGWIGEDDILRETASIAWYWTIIANKVLTTDQINQVISYFNLDKHVKLDVYYDTIRQGITNENHASFNDELTDFSGNGHNMKIYNSAWNKESGINDEGAWQTDGVTDYGQYVGDLGLKDYTIAVDRAYVEAKPSQVSIMSNGVDGSTKTPFLMEHIGINKILTPHSFGKYTALSELNINRFISYQSTYKYNRNNLDRGISTNTGSGLTIGRIGGVASQYANIALWSLLLFPYTLSEFLLERQLKRYKLGTLYPDMVEFRPIIKGGSIFKYLNVTTNEEIFAGDYIHVGDTIRFYVSGISGTANEVSSFTVNGVEGIPKGNNGDLFDAVVTKSPQKINITIDEYIRFEDIVQPYPVLLRFKDENGNEVSWGGKFRVGSTITRIGSAADSNLLPNIYNIFGLLLNDNQVTSSKVIVEKTMVFKAKSTYIFDNNEPNCILSPRLLRIPNSSYKILGHIPDISGHRNHGKINNSAYAGMSGANGYTEQTFSNWRYNTAEKRAEFTISNDVKLNIAKVIMARGAILYTLIGDYTTTNSIQRYKVTGVDENHPIVFGNDAPFDALLTVTTDGEYEVDWKTYGKNPCIFTTWTGDCNITIEQIGEYEGAYCLDGVDDFVTIPTATSGKQVFMKVNSRKSDCYLYDQRNNWTQYLGIVSTKDFIAYNYSNQRGKTYIDGILNENITANDLISITHNITVTNNRDDVEQYFPCIGTSFAKNSFAQMSLYDFMLFDNISTDDKIKELNEYVGIEGNTDDLFNETN